MARPRAIAMGVAGELRRDLSSSHALRLRLRDVPHREENFGSACRKITAYRLFDHETTEPSNLTRTRMRTDRELIEAIRNGDGSSFAPLVRRYERLASSTAWRILRDYHSVQDAVQNAFVEAFRQLDQLRSPDHFAAWVLKIVHREAVKIAAKVNRCQPLQLGTEATASEPSPLERHDELLAAIGGLPEQERIVVSLRYLEGHSVSEIAHVTGRPVGTVTKQLSRAVERLKATFREVHT